MYMLRNWIVHKKSMQRTYMWPNIYITLSMCFFRLGSHWCDVRTLPIQCGFLNCTVVHTEDLQTILMRFQTYKLSEIPLHRICTKMAQDPFFLVRNNLWGSRGYYLCFVLQYWKFIRTLNVYTYRSCGHLWLVFCMVFLCSIWVFISTFNAYTYRYVLFLICICLYIIIVLRSL